MPERDRRSSPLVALLRGYRPAPSEAGAHERTLSMVESFAFPFDRDVFDPGHLTASGLVLSPDGTSVLLVHHRRLARWLQPGGHVDPEDESPDAAARREVEEETGVGRLVPRGGLIDVDIHAIPARGEEAAHHHFDLRFGYVATDAEISPDDEVHDARWVEFGRLGEYAVDASTLRAMEKLASTAPVR